jgi:hypothetical protein
MKPLTGLERKMLMALRGAASASLCFCGEEDAPDRQHRRFCRQARAAIRAAENKMEAARQKGEAP